MTVEIKTWLWIHRKNLLRSINISDYDANDYRYDEDRGGYWILKNSPMAIMLILRGQEFDTHWRLHYQNGVLA